MRTKKIDLGRAKRVLATVWFAGSSVVLALVVLQSLLGKFGERVADAWSWLLPTVLPTLSLIAAVLVADARTNTLLPPRVDRFVFRLAAWASIGYLALVALTFAVEPFTTRPLLDLLQLSNLWLGPAQGLVGALLGLFFVRQPAPDNDDATGNPATR